MQPQWARLRCRNQGWTRPNLGSCSYSLHGQPHKLLALRSGGQVLGTNIGTFNIATIQVERLRGGMYHSRQGLKRVCGHPYFSIVRWHHDSVNVQHPNLVESFTCVPLRKLVVTFIPIKSLLALVYPCANFLLPLCPWRIWSQWC